MLMRSLSTLASLLLLLLHELSDGLLRSLSRGGTETGLGPST